MNDDPGQTFFDHAKRIVTKADAERRIVTTDERAEIVDLIDQGTRARKKAEYEALRKVLGEDDYPDRPAFVGGGGYAGGGLYAAVMAQGFDRKSHPDVVVSYKAATFDGSTEDMNRQTVASPGLGVDTRFLWPLFPQTAIAGDVTGITSFRQKSRTLPSPITDVVRAVDYTSAKAETDTETELVQETVHQIATIQSSVPNVIVENAQFRSFIEQDLRLAWNTGLDDHVVTEILGSTPSVASGGTNPVEVVLYAAEDVRANGYTPNVAVMSPGDALAFTLTQLSGGDSYIQNPNVGLKLVTVKTLADGEGFVADTSAAGQLYLSPIRLQVFEESAGSTNSSTVRFENHGLFLVQRPEAIVALAAS